MITAAAALLLGGALGKSAQLPLQTWLPDAMAGPSPVSAFIHAATMVTAGVYLIARTHVLFAAAPIVQYIVAIIGAVTLLMAGFSALTQHDIKRVLAYSTISQIGYMFLALGVGAWAAAIFHFMIHAFFKSLLFLAAGVVIVAMNEEHNMFKMGGLRKQLPFAFWTFLIGSRIAFRPAGYRRRFLQQGFDPVEYLVVKTRRAVAFCRRTCRRISYRPLFIPHDIFDYFSASKPRRFIIAPLTEYAQHF